MRIWVFGSEISWCVILLPVKLWITCEQTVTRSQLLDCRCVRQTSAVTEGGSVLRMTSAVVSVNSLCFVRTWEKSCWLNSKPTSGREQRGQSKEDWEKVTKTPGSREHWKVSSYQMLFTEGVFNRWSCSLLTLSYANIISFINLYSISQQLS